MFRKSWSGEASSPPTRARFSESPSQVKNSYLAALALGAAYAGICMGVLSPNLSIGDPGSGILLYAWIAATVFLLYCLLARSASLPARLRPLRLLMVLSLIVAMVPGVMAAAAMSIFESRAMAVDCDKQRRYVAMYRGGFGSTWFDVIEMKRVLPMVYTTRALKQYQRESVEDLRCLGGSGVEVRLSEHGKLERIETLGQQ